MLTFPTNPHQPPPIPANVGQHSCNLSSIAMTQSEGKLSILQWNIRGYFQNIGSLRYLTYRYNPDVILLQETKLRDNCPRRQGNYNVYHSNKEGSPHRGGVVILVRSSIPHTEINLNTGMTANAIKFQGRPGVSICNVYVQHDYIYQERDLDHLVAQLPGRKFIGGDFNAHSTVWGNSRTDRRGRCITDTLEREDLILLNDGSPTLLSTRGTYTAIDLSIASPTLAQGLEWHVHPSTEGSDHFPIFISSDIQIASVKKLTRYVESKADWNKFRATAAMLTEWRPPKDSINAEAANLKKIIRGAAEAAIPVSQGKTRVKPCWFSEEIQEAMLERNISLRNHRRRPNNTTYRLLREANTKVKNLIGEAKRRSWRNFTEKFDARTEPRQTWAMVRACKGKRKESYIPMIGTASNGIQTDSEEIANYFNENYVSYSADEHYTVAILKVKWDLSRGVSYTTQRPTRNIIYPVSYTELYAKIAKLKGRTPGRDRISYQMIREAGPEFTSRLRNLYNRIIGEGIYPHFWKHANVTPVPKGGGSECRTVNDFRPISFLPCMSKILEGILADRIVGMLEDLVPNEVHGFRPGRGTESLLLELEDELAGWLSAGDHGMVLSLDLQKAYERLTISTVAKQMRKCGFTPESIKLVVNFLSSRTITTVVNGHQSSPLRMDNGTPQGSPLSPILFIIYMIDLVERLKSLPTVRIYIYADNIFVTSSGKDTVGCLATAWESIRTWCKEVSAIIPEGSGEILHVCRKKRCNMESDARTVLGICPKPHMKVLGVYFSRSLRWNQQVNQVCTKVDNILNLTKMLSARNSYVPSDSLRHIARTLLSGTCGYAATLYGNAPKTTLAPLEKATRRVLRTMLGALSMTKNEALHIEAGFDVINIITDRKISLVARNISNPCNPHYPKMVYTSQHPNRPKKPSALFLAWETYKDRGGPTPLLDPIPHFIPQPPQALMVSKIMMFPELRRDSAPREAWLSRFREWYENHREEEIIYTDASSSMNGVAAAAISGQLDQYTNMFRIELETDTSASIAEMYAIFEVMKRLNGTGVCTSVLSDSQGSINAIYNSKNRSYMPRYIRSILIRNEGRIKLGWIPGHMGIEGNERADTLARSAGGEQKLVPPSEVYCRTAAARGEWRARWNKWTTFDSFLKRHWHSLKHPNLNPTLGKLQARVLTRSRLGYTRLTHGHWYNRTDKPQCNVCGGPLTIIHILKHCRKTWDFFGGEPPALVDLLDPQQGDDSPLFNLLRHLGFLYSI